jgi:hypothetical protein
MALTLSLAKSDMSPNYSGLISIRINYPTRGSVTTAPSTTYAKRCNLMLAHDRGESAANRGRQRERQSDHGAQGESAFENGGGHSLRAVVHDLGRSKMVDQGTHSWRLVQTPRRSFLSRSSTKQ